MVLMLPQSEAKRTGVPGQQEPRVRSEHFLAFCVMGIITKLLDRVEIP